MRLPSGVPPSIPCPLRGPVPNSTRRRTRLGACNVISCATKPPIEKPSTSTFASPSALMNATALAPICAILVGTSPEELDTPALLNRMTSRSLAKPSVTAGSQWSMVPAKCWLKMSGTPPGLPKRRRQEHRDMTDEEFRILVLRAVICVGIEDELGVRQLLLQDERVHGVDDHVLAAVHDQRRLAD